MIKLIDSNKFYLLKGKELEVEVSEDFSWLDTLKAAMADSSIGRVWLLGKDCSGLIGLVNCLRKEPGGEKIRCVFDGKVDDLIRSKDLVMNVRQGDEFGSFRYLLETISDSEKLGAGFVQLEHAYVNATSRGDLSSLRWIQQAQPKPEQSEVECKVAFAALNFRDIMLATGKLSPEAIPNYHKMNDALLGMEFSGITGENQRCMGIVAAKGLATSITADKSYLWQVPESWSLEEAATVPVAYSTAYYSLIVRGGLREGESVLIHAGSGAVGQAAIAIAISLKCLVFTTVSSAEKRQFLKSRFGLPDSSFASSRDSSFETHVMQQTRGRGVDLVLNSLSGK